MRIFTLLIATTILTLASFEQQSTRWLTQTDNACFNIPTDFVFVGPLYWSPDGKYIAFVAETTERRDIWVVESSGSHCSNLTSQFESVGLGFSWSPSGEQVAFEARVNSENVSNIWIINLDGSQSINLTDAAKNSGTLRNTQPKWSPSGQYIGFEAVNEDRTDIIIVDVQTNNAMNITHGIGTINRGLSWSPDSERVAFFSREQISVESQRWAFPSILVMYIDRTFVTNVTQAKMSDIEASLPTDADLITITDIEWSPVGNLIAFTLVYDFDSDIFLIDDEGGELFHLTYVSFFSDLHPAWSPDGGKIAFTMLYSDGASDVWVIETGGVVPVIPEKLTRDGENKHRYPAWSPDGEKIAIQSNTSGTWNVWIVNSDGSDPLNLTSSQQ